MFTSINQGKEVSKPPVQEFSATEFQGKSVQDVEGIVLSKHKAGARTSLFLILDDNGVRDETIIVAKRAINPVEGQELYLDVFNRARVPWIETHSMWCNLSIANMDFEDFVIESPRADGKRRWFAYQKMMGEDHYIEFIDRRDVVLGELRNLDLT